MAKKIASIHVEVLEGRNLVPMDSDGQSDPYCVILVGDKKKKTKAVRHTLFPKWEADNSFDFNIDSNLTGITIEVYDWDRFSSDDRMGLVNIPMTQVSEYIVDTIKWYPLLPMKPDDRVSGDIKLKIRYDKEKSQTIEKNPLIRLIKENDVQGIESMILKSKLDYSISDNEGTPSIHIAAASGSVPLIMVMLKGSDLKITVKDHNGNSPLHIFAQKCVNTQSCEELIQKFIERGCGINDENHLGETPLHKACLSNLKNTSVIENLLSKGARVNHPTKSGDTPLHYAIKLNKLEFVRYLLQNGADYRVEGGKPPRSPLGLATDLDNYSVINKLEQVLAISDWLNELQLEVLTPTFIKNEIFMDVLTEIDEHTLDRLKITVSGQRTKLLRAIRKMKDPLATSSNSSLRSSSSSQVLNYDEQQCNINNNNNNNNSSDNNNNNNNNNNIINISANNINSNNGSSNRNSLGNRSTTNLNNINNNSNGIASKSSANLTSLKTKDNNNNNNINNIIEQKTTSPTKPILQETEIKTTTTTTTAAEIKIETDTTTEIKTETTVTSLEATTSTVTTGTVVVEGPNLNVSELSTLKHINLDSDSWVIDEKLLKYNELLGTGASGKVYKGTYNGQEVAIKVLKSFTGAKDIAEFKKEFQIVSALRAPGVVYFHGAGIKDKLCIVMEYCSRGSLYHILKDDTIQFNWDNFFHLGTQAVSSLDSLHNWQPQVLHRDLKSLNLLVNDNWTVKICDFGLSRFDTGSNLETLGKLRGTYAYVAPEVYFGNKYTTKSDVYSMGMILWEMTYRCIKGTHQLPYAEYPHLKFDYQILISSAKKDVRPTTPLNTPQSLTDLIAKTLLKDSSLRPTTIEFYDELCKIRDEYHQNRQDWDSRRNIPTTQKLPFITGKFAIENNNNIIAATIDTTTTTTTTTASTSLELQPTTDTPTDDKLKLQYQSSNPNLLNISTTDSIQTPISKIKEQLLTRTRSSSSPMEPKSLKKLDK